MTKHFSVRDYTKGISSYNAADYYTIYLTDKKGVSWKTYVSDTNRNFAHWLGVLAVPGACIVSGNWRVKDDKKKIINADSIPIIEWTGPQADLADALELFIDSDESNEHDVWGDIFE